MANNRMYFMHRPSRKAVYLGKRMGWGWYSVPNDIKQRIERLFQMVEDQDAEGDQDDFCIALEDGDNAPLTEDDWCYGERDEDGIISLPNVEGTVY